jgi:hypothetical protein
MTARLPQAEKKQAPLVQAHAFDHYLTGKCDGRFPIHDSRPEMRCPTCLRWLPRTEFNLEHAPQWSGQSRFGEPWLIVSACARCNSEVAGSTYESEAASVRDQDEADQDPPACRVHGTGHGESTFNAGWMTTHNPVTLTDLKTAYLIAFAVLGYSWVTARRLDPLRAALEHGVIPDGEDALMTCGFVTAADSGRTVRELIAPRPMVLVVAPEAEFVVALPSPGTPDVRAACMALQNSSVKYRDYAWPLMVRETHRLRSEIPFTKPEDAWDAGLTFHLDRCDQPHSTTINPARTATRAINARTGSRRPHASAG